MRIWNTLIRFWMPVCMWCAGIFIESSFSIPDIGPKWLFKDKAAHFIIYAALGILISRALSEWRGWQGRKIWLVAAAIALTSLYGLSDEWHQSFVIGRTADFLDWIADLFGSAVGAVAFTRVILPRQRTLARSRADK